MDLAVRKWIAILLSYLYLYLSKFECLRAALNLLELMYVYNPTEHVGTLYSSFVDLLLTGISLNCFEKGGLRSEKQPRAIREKT